MAYNTKSIIKDVNDKPVPQYYNENSDNYEVAKGTNGMLKCMIYDSDGTEIVSNDIVDKIANKLDELIEVINNGI